MSFVRFGGALLAASMFLAGPALTPSAYAAGKGSQQKAQSAQNPAQWETAVVGRGSDYAWQATPGATASRVQSRVTSAKFLSLKAKKVIGNGKNDGGLTDSILNFKHSESDPELGDTPPFELVSNTKGLKFKAPKGHVPDYENYSKPGAHTIFDVSGVPSSGIIDVTSLMPASGHVNAGGRSKNDTARFFHDTNTYFIEVTHPDGTTEKIDNIASDKASKSLVTPHDLRIQLSKGSTFVRFAPKGSMGIGGYNNGRVIELRWDGNGAAQPVPVQQ